jgi:hypothetical protein
MDILIPKDVYSFRRTSLIELSVFVCMFAKTFIRSTLLQTGNLDEGHLNRIVLKSEAISTKYSIFFPLQSFIFRTMQMEISVSFSASITSFSLVALRLEIIEFKAVAQGIATST